MNRFKMIAMCLLAIIATCLNVKAQEVTITLEPGWNWISIPLMDTLDFETAMGSVTPIVGDIIKSRWGSATYTSDGQWRGSISQFYPGYGYHYKSNRTMPVFLTFTAQQPNPQSDDHEYVDLGLPSGTLWATCNIGANAPEEYGDYFAWGETQPKDYYDWSTYQHCNGSYNTLTKYCNNPDYGYIGFTDSITILLSEDDAATANWGADWRMPTKEEWQELYNSTTIIWTTLNGVNGRLFTASNGNSIFFPATGYRGEDGLYSIGSHGYYWTSSLYTYQSNAWDFHFNSANFSVFHSVRCFGESVRPVRSIPQNNAPIGAINGKFTINANGNQVYFSQGNLQYIGSAVTPYWKFADNQWDYLGENGQEDNGVNQNIDRDLFGWGTSGFNHGAICYQPWSTSSDYRYYYAYGRYWYGLYEMTGEADWGYNAIVNGGDTPNIWRTPTKNEWEYVFNIRSTSSGIRYAKAVVNGENGIILLPDDWNSSYYLLNNTNQSEVGFNINIIDVSHWSILEQYGAVFLPAAGCRDPLNGFFQDVGLYCSSSSYSERYVYNLCFFSSSVLTQDTSEGRQVRCSVRLVQDAE